MLKEIRFESLSPYYVSGNQPDSEEARMKRAAYVHTRHSTGPSRFTALRALGAEKGEQWRLCPQEAIKGEFDLEPFDEHVLASGVR
jgi:hypothetical protein